MFVIYIHTNQIVARSVAYSFTISSSISISICIIWLDSRAYSSDMICIIIGRKKGHSRGTRYTCKHRFIGYKIPTNQGLYETGESLHYDTLPDLRSRSGVYGIKPYHIREGFIDYRPT